jgi:hypothetical protein
MSFFQMYWQSLKWVAASGLALVTVAAMAVVAFYVLRVIWKALYYAVANDEEAQIRRGETSIIANFMKRFRKKK